MRLILSILFIPLSYYYAIAFYDLILQYSFQDTYQLTFFVSFAISFLLCIIFLKSTSYISIFKHELTHNIWALLTFNKPVGFHVRKDSGGSFEYSGKGNFMITLSPYFFMTLPLLLLPVFLIIKQEFYLFYYILFGLSAGFQVSTMLKDIHPRQDDIRKNSYLFSLIIIVFGTIINYGLILAFIEGSWSAMLSFLTDGFMGFVNALSFLVSGI